MPTCLLTAVQCTNLLTFLVMHHNLVSLKKKECETCLCTHEYKHILHWNINYKCMQMYTPLVIMAYLLAFKSTSESVVSTGDSVVVLNASETWHYWL